MTMRGKSDLRRIVCLKKSKRSEETDNERQIRLEKDSLSKKSKRSKETDNERQIRLEKDSLSKKSKRSEKTDSERQIRLEKDRVSKKVNGQTKLKAVHNALVWLKNNNPHYSELIINEDALSILPENGVPSELMTVEADDYIISDDDCSPDTGPPTDNPLDDIVYNFATEMSSFLPVVEQQQQEINAVRNKLSENEPVQWPSVDNQPLNEYQISHLATMGFPTLFPDGQGDPTNQGLLRDVPLTYNEYLRDVPLM